MVGLPDTAIVAFRLEVSRFDPLTQTSAVVFEETYPSVAGTGVDAGVFRGNRPIRLVSNARPSMGSVPTGAKYDDEIGSRSPDQTPLVQLEDVVRVEAIVADTVAAVITYPVGRPASESGSYAVRTVELNWRWTDRVSGRVAPEVIAARASEDWAQAAIHIMNKPAPERGLEDWGSFDPEKVRNVLEVRFRRGQEARRNSTFAPRIAVDGNFCTPSVAYSAGTTLLELKDDLIAAVQATCGVSAAWSPNEAARDGERTGTFIEPDEAGKVLITIGSAHRVELSDRYEQSEVRASQVNISNRGEVKLQHLAALAASVRDDDPLTVDVVALHEGALGRGEGSGEQTMGAGYDDSRVAYSFTNVLFTAERSGRSAVDADDDYPLVVGHELGHVLYGGGHPNQNEGVIGTPNGHPAQSEHLMYSASGVQAEIVSGGGGLGSAGSHKRLSQAYVDFARAQASRGIPVLQRKGRVSGQERLASSGDQP